MVHHLRRIAAVALAAFTLGQAHVPAYAQGFEGTSPLPLDSGGTGVELADPVSDQGLFFDFSEGEIDWFTVGEGLTFNNTALEPDNDLGALEALTGTGVLARTGSETYTERTITGTANEIEVADGDGVSGNPTLGLPDVVIITTALTVPNAGLHLLDTDASHDLIVSPGSDLTADRTLTVTTGDGDRTLDISAADVTVTSFAASLLDDPDAVTARGTLGLADTTTDHAIARFDGTEGQTQDSDIGIDDSGNLLLLDGAALNWNAGDCTLTEGTDTLTLAGTCTLVTEDQGLQIGQSVPFSDSTGTLTLQNVDAVDATTESTIEAAIDTLANLASVQGFDVTLTGDFIRAGAHSLTLTTTGATDITLPVTGTLATLAGAETFTNKTLTAPAIGTQITLEQATADYTLLWADPAAGRQLTIADPGDDDSFVFLDATQTLTGKTIDSADNTLTLDLSEGTLTGTASEFNAALSDGDFATLAGTETLTNKTLTAPEISQVELGDASDTTLTRVSAGVVAVEGVAIVTSAVATALTDADADVLWGWKDSESTYKNFGLADIAIEGSPTTGDYVLLYTAEGGLARVNWANLPAGGGGGSDAKALAFSLIY